MDTHILHGRRCAHIFNLFLFLINFGETFACLKLQHKTYEGIFFAGTTGLACSLQ